MRDPSMNSTSPGFIVRTTSAHSVSGAIVSAPFMAMIVHLPLPVMSAVRYALSQSVTRGPASTIPSRARAASIIEAWGPVPIGLRETASAPIRRAAARTLKPALTWRPSSLPQSEPPPYTGAAPANTWSTRICPMRTTRPAPGSEDEAGAGTSGTSASLAPSVSGDVGALAAGS